MRSSGADAQRKTEEFSVSPDLAAGWEEAMSVQRWKLCPPQDPVLLRVPVITVLHTECDPNMTVEIGLGASSGANARSETDDQCRWPRLAPRGCTMNAQVTANA